MLNIILMILKVNGIIAAVLIGILIVLIIEILWVPFRYRIVASKYEKIKVRINFSWLLRLICILIQYEDSKLIYRIRVFGIPILDSRRTKKEKKRNKKIKKKPKLDEQRKAKTSSKHLELKKEEIDQENDELQINQTILRESDVEQEKVPTKNRNLEPKINHRSMKYRIRKIIVTIKTLLRKLSSFVRKIINGFGSLKERLKTAIDLIKKVMAYPKKVGEFLNDADNKAAIGLIFQSMKLIVKHASPKRVKGEIILGFDDPCTTGQVLGGISVATAYMNIRKLRIIPEFQEAKLEGFIRAKGRIYSFVVLRIIIRLIRDKHFQIFKDRLKQLKED